MAKKAAHGVDITLNSVAFEGYVTDWSLNFDQETPGGDVPGRCWPAAGRGQL